MDRRVDVAILGGGLAGNLLARQLRRQVPQASVALFERDTERSYKVGESTVEIAANYLTRRLGLSTYLYKEHLPKNGLRFFFDTAARDAALPRMSELGVAHLPPCPSFQLDRARLERDLLALNEADGVDVHVGTRVADLALDGGGGHRFRATGPDGDAQVHARWVIDATGRASAIARQLDLRVPEKEHKTAAVWARVRGVRDIDQWPDAAWHARAHHTSRVLSTNHFCYPGYWIWFIPLRDGLTSVGLVADRSVGWWRPALHGPEGFLAKLREHRAPRELLEGAELVDIGHYTQLPFRTKRFFGERWALVGDAAAFTDPFYSPGSDFIALENDLVSDLVARDLAGEDIADRRDVYDRFMHMRFDTTLMLYKGLYRTFGSYRLLAAKVYFDCACYYNLWFDSYAQDEHLDLRKAKGMLRRQGPVRAVMENFAEAFQRTADAMLTRGDYFTDNVDHHQLGPEVFGALREVGLRRKRPEVDRATEAIFNRTLAMLGDVLDDDALRVPRTLQDFAEGPVLSSASASVAQVGARP